MIFNEQTVNFRELRLEDIPTFVTYWHHAPPGFMESMGVDPKKLAPQHDLEDALHKELKEIELGGPTKTRKLIVEYLGRPIGSHNLNEIKEGESGLFHAHFWDPSLRGKGLGTYTYPRACKIFMRNFNLPVIRFVSPIINPKIHRIKEKLGLKPLGEVDMNVPFLFEGTRGIEYRLTAEDLKRLGL